MKKLFLFLVLACLSLGARAEAVSFGTGSSYEIDGTTATITIGAAGDLAKFNTELAAETGSYYSAFANVTEYIFKTSGYTFSGSDESAYSGSSMNFSIASNATINFRGCGSDNYIITNVAQKVQNADVVILPDGITLSGNWAYLGRTNATCFCSYSSDGTTLNVTISNSADTVDLTSLITENVTTVALNANQLTTDVTILGEVDTLNIDNLTAYSSYNISVSGDIETIENNGNSSANLKVVQRKSSKAITCTADELLEKLAAVGTDKAVEIDITSGKLTQEAMDSIAKCTALKIIDLSGAENDTVNFTIPATVTTMTLGANAKFTGDTSAGSTLKYIYFSGSSPLKIHVLQAGGLVQAASDYDLTNVTPLEIAGDMTNAEDFAQLTTWNSKDLNKVYVLADATMSDDNVETLAGYGTTIGLVLPSSTAITSATMESWCGTDKPLQYAIKAQGDSAFVVAGQQYGGSQMGAAADMAKNYIGEAKTLYVSGSSYQIENLTMAPIYMNATSATDITFRNMQIKGKMSLDGSKYPSIIEQITLNNVQIDDTFKLHTMSNLYDLTVENGTGAKAIIINNCQKFDHVDLKGCYVGTATDNNGEITITNNTNLRYVILPHNYRNATGCDVTTGNDSLYAVIATAYLSDYVTNTDGDTLKCSDGVTDSTAFVKRTVNGVEQYLLTANYNIYRGGIPADMMAIAKSMPYYQCTVHCRKPIWDGEPVTDANGIYVGRALLTQSDIDGMNEFQAERFDIARTAYVNPINVHARNPHVEWLILPDNMDWVLSTSSSKGSNYQTFESRVQECDKLIAAVSYCGDPDKGNCNSDSIATVKGIMTATAEPGRIAELLDITYHKWGDVVTAHKFFSTQYVKNLVMVGQLNAADITLNTDNIALVDTAGNYRGQGLADGEKADITMAGLKNFSNTNGLTRIDLTRALFPVNNDMRIGQLLAGAYLAELYLPIAAGQEELPDSCLLVSTDKIHDVCIPGNIKRIGKYAVHFASGSVANHIFTTLTDSKGNGYPVRLLDRQYDKTKIIDRWEYLDDYLGQSFADNAAKIEYFRTNGGCVTISENITEIGSAAFCGEYIRDVYAMSRKAPKCAFNAFSSRTYCGNNTGPSSGTKSVTLDEYYHAGGTIGCLYFPSTCDSTNIKRYTDPTRDYTIPDTYGATDGNGSIVFWPNQVDWNRSFAQACAGVTWDFWKDGDNGADYTGTYAHEGYSGVAGYGVWGAGDVDSWGGDSILAYYYGYSLLDKTYSSASGANRTGLRRVSQTNTGAAYSDWVDDTSATYDTDYMGWHQFVLAGTFSPDSTVADSLDYDSLDWYTICVPVNVTRKQVLTYFGVPGGKGNRLGGKEVTEDIYPLLSTLYGVDRDYNENKIWFRFTHDLCSNKQTWDFGAGTYYDVNGESNHYEDAANDDDVVIKAGCPYHIKPYVPHKYNNDSVKYVSPGKYLLSFASVEKVDNWLQEGQVIDYKVQSRRIEGNDTTIEKTGSGANATPYYYYFVGNYQNVEPDTLPYYTFFLYPNKAGKKKWFQHVYKKRTFYWSDYSCIISCVTAPTSKDSTASYVSEGAGTTFKVVSLTDAVDDNIDPQASTASGANRVRAFSRLSSNVDVFVPKESSVESGIVEIETDADDEPDTQGDDVIYGINGQCYGTDTKSLSKGVYIVNGKKFVVE